MIADWLSSTGFAAAKPAMTALVLPPVPLLLLALLGAWRARGQRRGGMGLALASLLGLWLCGCEGVADWLQRALLQPPPALSAESRAALRTRAPGGGLAIVVLGGGVLRDAPEYGMSDLHPASLQRLRYGVWLGRETGIPVAVSGGAGWALRDGAAISEANVAARIAAEDLGRPLRWIETESRDTRENALDTTTLLARQGVHEIVLVTHGWHMPRALREFRAAAARPGIAMQVDAAPIGLTPSEDRLRWIPSGQGADHVATRLRELLGLLLAP